MRTIWLKRCPILPFVYISLFCLPSTQAQPAAAPAEYLGDQPELIYSTSQSFGELGWNVAAHVSEQAGAPLQVGK